MKRQISCLLFEKKFRYTVKVKEHWWNKWQYIMDGRYPKLFTLDELIKYSLISLEEMEHYFKADIQDEIVWLY